MEGIGPPIWSFSIKPPGCTSRLELKNPGGVFFVISIDRRD
jgi:hypothetical protein